MKKFLSIVAVLAMVFALAVPALAVDSVEAEIKTETKVTTDDGQVLTVDVAVVDVISKEQSASLQEEKAKLVDGTNIQAISDVKLVDVELVDEEGNEVSADYFNKEGKTLTVAFAYDNASDLVAVLYWNDETQAWDSADFSVDGSTVSVVFEHLCTVAFVLGTVKAAADTNNSGTKAPGNQTKPSPQTGYNTALWAIAAMALILCAGYCFVSSRKKTAA